MSGDGRIRVSRRGLFQILGSGAVAAGLDACADLAPPPVARRVRGPERRVRTVCGACPAGCGISARVVGGDVVSVEGIEGHLVNGLGLCPRGVAEVQSLYHPERLRGPRLRSRAAPGGPGLPVSWEEALAHVASAPKDAPLVVAAGPATLPAERLVLEHLAAARGGALVEVAPAPARRPEAAFSLAWGRSDLAFDVTRADAVLVLGADPLQASESPVETQRAFASLRRAGARLVVAGSRISTTGAFSDRSILVPEAGGAAFFGLAVARALADAGAAPGAEALPGLVELLGAERFATAAAAAALGLPERRILETATALGDASRPLVVADGSDLETGVAALALDALLGAFDREGGIRLRRGPTLPPELLPKPPPAGSTASGGTGAPPIVLLHRANPAYLRPWDDLLSRAAFAVAVTPFDDESASRSDVVLPPSAPLETGHVSWGTTLEGNGFVGAGPKATKPLGDTRPAIDVLLQVARALGVPMPWADSDALHGALAAALELGPLVKRGGAKARPAEGDPPAFPAFRWESVSPVLSKVGLDRSPEGAPADRPLALAIPLSLPFLGGDGAHLPYLHGFTSPAGREVWRTLVEVHPSVAAALGFADRDPVVVESSRGRILAEARVHRGVHPGAVAIALGLGRTGLGRWADGRGANPLVLVDDPARPTFVRVRRA